MTISIDSIKCQKIRFILTGQNWDYNINSVNFKRIELLSNDPKYSRGVLSTFVSQSENHDPHKCPILLYASNYDLNKFHLMNSSTNICTHGYENSYFQIEITKGTVVLDGYRLERNKQYKMRSYKVICTDDVFKPEEKWTTLIEINEQSKEEHKLLDIYKFPKPSPPTKFIRLIQTGPKWDDTLNLYFYHFDLFGSYIT